MAKQRRGARRGREAEWGLEYKRELAAAVARGVATDVTSPT